MKTRQMLVAAAAAAVVPLALAACSSGSSGGQSSGTSSVTLTVEDYYTGHQADVIDGIYQSCAKAAGDKVTVSHVPADGLISKVLQQSSSRTLPDVLMLDNPDVQQIAASGALAPLSDFGITGDGVAKGVIAAGTYKGKLYGLAPIVNSLALFYNKDLLSAAGVTPPKTWDDLAADAKKLTTPDRYGFAFSGVNTYEGTWQFMPWMWSNGGSEQNIDSPETVQALQFLTDLVQSGSASKSVVSWSQSDVNNQFIAGKAAMMENGPWQIPSLQGTNGLNWGYVELPVREAGQTSQAPLGGETFNVANTGDKNKMAAAGKLVACINSPKNEIVNAQANLEIPSNESAAADYSAKNPTYGAFVQIVANARARTAILGDKWPATATKIYTAEQLALTGKASPSAALKQVQSGN